MSSPPPRRARFSRLRGAVDRVPTRWFAGVATGLFLAVSAAFGGLATVASEPDAVAASGDRVAGSPFAVTIDRAILIDALPELSLEPERSGDRLLAVVLTAENTTLDPLTSGEEYGLTGGIQLDGVPELAAVAGRAVYRWDDSTESPLFQPGVPAEVAVFWDVPSEVLDAGALADGGELTVRVIDRQLIDTTLYDGGRWEPTGTATRVTVPIRDVGAGTAPG
ncbi:MAG: hypothetical protein ABW040_05230 [Microbacteriaceae bacterium]